MNKAKPRTAERLNLIIKNFLQKYNCFDEQEPWEIRESTVGGLGIFAKRDINVGELIFKDFPVIIGPRAVPDCPLMCVVCFTCKNLKGCSRNCGLPVCSNPCQNSEAHLQECKIITQSKTHLNKNTKENGANSENVNITAQDAPNENNDLNNNINFYDTISQRLFTNSTPIRALVLDTDDKEVVTSLIAHQHDNHGREIDVLKEEEKLCFEKDDEDFMKFVCCVMDANAFEVTTGKNEDQTSARGLYPLGSLANHRCYPNATHVFDNEHKMICRAAVRIPKDSEIFHSYSRVVWGSVTRCKDPTEFGTYMSAILCKKCRGNVIPVNPYKQTIWQCEDCKIYVTGQEVGQLIQMLGSILCNIQPANFEFMHSFLRGKLSTVVPQTNQVAIELKYKIIWCLGHKPDYRWQVLPIDLINLKIDICKDMLDLLEKLKIGQSKMRGLLLYELYCCHKELQKRNTPNIQKNIKLNNTALLFEEAKQILAPEELKI